MSFYSTITEAVTDIAVHGFDSEDRVAEWVARIRAAAEADLTPMHVLENELRKSLGAAYKRYVENEKIMVYHGDMPRFTLERVKPKLRAELDRRIAACASQIKLNRTQAVERTLQRFQGWSTSIPIGGSDVVAKNPVKSDIRKAMASLPFEERRVAIDQGYKLISAISSIVATDGGAIAGKWVDHGHTDKSYNARPEHLKRTGKIYLIRDNWAQKAGYCKPGPAGYTDEITQPGEEIYCRCYYVYIYGLRKLPEDMLTEKGRDFVALPVAA